jgi:hypothetical protein
MYTNPPPNIISYLQVTYFGRFSNISGEIEDFEDIELTPHGDRRHLHIQPAQWHSPASCLQSNSTTVQIAHEFAAK